MDIGRAGISIEATDDLARQARGYEQLGYDAIWIAGGQLSSLGLLDELAGATERMTIGTAVIPTGVYPAEQVARSYAGLETAAPGRFLVGLGAAQQPRSLGALRDYLDRLDRDEPVVPVDRRYLAALGPRKLELARDRFAGAITLLVTPEFTEQARVALGGAQQLVMLLAVADLDPVRARATARETLGFLTQVPGYRAHLIRIGFSEGELDRLDDRVVDALVPWGSAETVAAAVRKQWDAGADQVIISPTGPGAEALAADLSELLGLRAG
ncbi:TIGR03620 family F420-dependent LLM class oxidoreductase [Microlunatus sp. GCM10028923]|uniref:TIGR03620 family F420-dependent LLM class oxidoreductase n=1 Tax=Microlunatus sp. GCM10028923 TaxID=3273400 RepID=UPI00361090AD